MTLRERYEKETGMVSHQYGGVPREEYVTWLEKKLSVWKNSSTKDLMNKQIWRQGNDRVDETV